MVIEGMDVILDVQQFNRVLLYAALEITVTPGIPPPYVPEHLHVAVPIPDSISRPEIRSQDIDLMAGLV
jgi:hypothetical protein